MQTLGFREMLVQQNVKSLAGGRALVMEVPKLPDISLANK